MNWRKFFRKATPLIGVNLSGIAVIFALFELTLRAVGWVDTGSPYPPRGSVVHRTSEFEVTYRYNDRGFRSDTDFRPFEQAGAPPPDVVAIGDSFTEGFGVESTQTFSAELERILRRRNPAARVLNLGISGTGPNDYARVFAYALRLRPRAIVIGFFVGNDAAESRPPRAPSRWRTVQFLDGKIRTARRLLNPSPFRSGLVGTAYRWWVCRNAGISTEEFQRRYERLAPELRRLVDDEKINFHLVLLGLLQPDAIYNNLALADRASREGLQHADILFRAMRQECERRGIALHIAAIPASVQVSARYHALLASLGFTHLDACLGESVLERSAAKLASASGLDFADFTVPFSDADRDRYYFPIDSHFTAAGHRRLAELIAARFFPPPAGSP